MLRRNAVELSSGMEQSDSGRGVVPDVSLNSFFHGEGRVACPLHRSGAGALPARRIRAFSDFLNRFPGRSLQLLRGESRLPGNLAADNAERADERHSVRVEFGLVSSFAH